MIHNDITCALTAGPGSVGRGAGAALSYNQVKFNFLLHVSTSSELLLSGSAWWKEVQGRRSRRRAGAEVEG